MGLRLLSGGSSGSTRTRGPDGTRIPPFTQPYSTPATTTGVTPANIQATLNACTGGEVLEMSAAADYTGAVITLADVVALRSATTNVTIRPPLGTRKAVAGFIIDCDHVTVAGVNVVSTIKVTASHSGFWRVVDEVSIQRSYTTASTAQEVGQFSCEFAAPYWTFLKAGDRIQISAQGAGGKNTGILFDGEYVASKNVDVYLTASWDDGSGPYTNPGQPINYSNGGATLAVASGITIATLAGNFAFGPPTLAVVAWLDDPAQGQAVRIKIKINGVDWQTITLDQSPADLNFRLVRGLTTDFTTGDVVTMDIEQVGTTFAGAGLHVVAGVDTGAGPGPNGPDVHGDTYQVLSVSGGKVPDITFRDCVMGPPNSNRALQIDTSNTIGEMVVDNCFLGRIAGGHAWGLTSAAREYVVDSTFQKDVALDDTGGGRKVFMRNSAASYTGSPLDPSNVDRGGVILPVPPCPDLVAAWPECPYTVL